MRKTLIPKGNGKFREIFVPSRQEKAICRSILGQIEDRAEKLVPKSVAHGFTRRRSAVTNALAHVGHRFTVAMDLRDFFDHIGEKQLSGKIPQEMMNIVLFEGSTKQGLPTSPACSNIAAADLDKAILRLFNKNKKQVVYTRYADDLSFSFDEEGLGEWIIENVTLIVRRCGFHVATEKTHTFDQRAGRRMITGIAVDDAIHIPRSTKRRLRAAIHQKNTAQAAGLLEWSKLKPPRQKPVGVLRSGSVIDEVKKIASTWSLGNVHVDKIPEKDPDVDLGDNCFITGDPVYALGMSTFTTGWTSCMSHPNGSRRRGTVFWMHLRGTRIAALLSEKTGVHGGVERRLMRARCLVHKLRNGFLVYDRIYGSQEDCEKLKEKLEKHGVLSFFDAKKRYPGEKVEGHAPSNWRSWFDNLKTLTSKAKSGRWAGKTVRVCHL